MSAFEAMHMLYTGVPPLPTGTDSIAAMILPSGSHFYVAYNSSYQNWQAIAGVFGVTLNPGLSYGNAAAADVPQAITDVSSTALPTGQTQPQQDPSSDQTKVNQQCKNEDRVILYHYTREQFVQGILTQGLRPSAQIPGIPRSDAQWGDGQYLTDLTPSESSTVTRAQHSYALFKNPRKWGLTGSLPNIAWIAFTAVFK